MQVSLLSRNGSLGDRGALKSFLPAVSSSDCHEPTEAAIHDEPKASPGFDWDDCLRRFDDAQVRKLAEWRGYTVEFCHALHADGLVGLYQRKIAFPVFDDDGEVVACHWRKDARVWYYDPKGTTVTPLVLGSRNANDFWVFESQWDAFAIMDRLGWYSDVALRERVCIVITRGSGNGKAITGLCQANSRVFAFAQNDPLDAECSSPAKKWLASVISHAGCSVLSAKIPGEFKDANDWTRAGAAAADILAAIDSGELSAAPSQPVATPLATQDVFIVLPSHDVSITDCAEKLFPLMAGSESLFTRNGTVTEVVSLKGEMNLQKVSSHSFRSRIEEHGNCMSWRKGDKGGMVLKPTTPSDDIAKALLGARAVQHLPPINAVVNAPLLLSDGSGCRIVERGYDRHSGMMVASGGVLASIPLAKAIESLQELVAEFDFQKPADRSRALATLITPALKFGGHLAGRIPINVCEADQSQSGKTYLFQCASAIYNEEPSMITQKKGGVGSDDETFNSALVRGRPFILFDNRRDEFESAHLEAFATSTGLFSARVPYEGTVWVDPSLFVISLTSNGIVTTRDFANRASIVRIRKREKYQFKKYPEGDLFAHVKANQAYYLGCVFSVAVEWLKAGKPRTEEVRHTFREWAQSLDWIVRNILREAPLIDNHEEAQKRFSNQSLSLVRKIGLAVTEAGMINAALTCSEIYDLLMEQNLEVPMIGNGGRKAGARSIGSEMKKLFNKPDVEDCIETDGFEIERTTYRNPRDDGKGYIEQKKYAFNPCEAPTAPPPETESINTFPTKPTKPTKAVNIIGNTGISSKVIELTVVGGLGGEV